MPTSTPPPDTPRAMRIVLFDKIRPLWFFVAFAVGLCACYVLTPKPVIVTRFPSPINAGTIVYNGKTAEGSPPSCFTYAAERVECTKDTKPQPAPTLGDTP